MSLESRGRSPAANQRHFLCTSHRTRFTGVPFNLRQIATGAILAILAILDDSNPLPNLDTQDDLS